MPNFNPENLAGSPAVIYHANCPDGFGAAYSAWCCFGDNAQYIAYHHGDVMLNVEDRDVIMLDCCYPTNDLISAHMKARSFLVLDHHISAQKESGHLPFCHFDMHKSGAGLAWDYFHPDQPRPALINFVEARDLWRWDNFESNPFCLNLDCQPRTFDSWHKIALLDQKDLAQFISAGQAMRVYAENTVNLLVENAVFCRFMGYKVWLLNVPRPIVTDDCGAILANRENTDFSVMWNSVNLDEVKVSLRSNGKFDVSAVAVSLGGGGHQAAAGLSLTMAAFKGLVSFD